jgi:hypothetical protein
MLVAPWRKHLAFTFGSSIGSGDFHNIRHAARTSVGEFAVRSRPRKEAPGG